MVIDMSEDVERSFLINEELKNLKDSYSRSHRTSQHMKETLQVLSLSTDRAVWNDVYDYLMNRVRNALAVNIDLDGYRDWHYVIRRMGHRAGMAGFLDIKEKFEFLSTFLYAKISLTMYITDRDEMDRRLKQELEEHKFRSACAHVHVMSYKGD